MIRSWKDKAAERLFAGGPTREYRSIEKVARRKLDMLDAAKKLDDLRSPPGNMLKLLAGSRSGQHSMRINDQWRICFVWTEGGPEDVEIVDYH